MTLFYLPPFTDETKEDSALRAGVDWLRAQATPGLVVVPDAMTARRVEAMRARRREFGIVAEGRLAFHGQDVSAVLLVWPTPSMLSMVSVGGRLGETTNVCVLERGITGWQSSWLRAHQAVDARYETVYPGASVPVLSQAMRVRLREFAWARRPAIARGLAEIIEDGQHVSANGVWAWALAEGYGAKRASLLQELAVKAAQS
ncbi:hypothetical protein [Salinibacterium sp. ZJ450]|uniref:hypothetical protein n=1 Tax=Salinibacterium sp. ZJ450 TaxID=2708338 RepID=UPI00141E097F|nr:hypothetical protein [Salinibacterium sp. ZJ450]